MKADTNATLWIRNQYRDFPELLKRSLEIEAEREQIVKTKKDERAFPKPDGLKPFVRY